MALNDKGEAVTMGDAELVGLFDQGSDKWHAARLELVGSSDVAAVLGLSQFKSAYTLWHEKRGLITPIPPSPAMQRKLDYGHHMEPFVAKLFADGRPGLEPPRLQVGTWRNVVRTWQGCNPDALVTDADGTVPLELKTFPSLADWQDGPPAGYVAQLMWQVDVFGCRGGWIAGYGNLGGDYVEHWFDADPFVAAAVRARVKAFLDSDTPPEIDGSDSTYQTIRRQNSSIVRGAEVEVPQDIAEQYLEARANLKAAESESLRWGGHLLAHMGTAQYAIYEGRKIASRVAGRGEDPVPYLKEQ